MTILSHILARKKEEIALLPVLTVTPSKKRSLVSAVLGAHPSLIAEIKPVSPVQGRLIEMRDISALVDIYDRNAHVISVLCDTATFGGGFNLLANIRRCTELPLLAKDFVLDERQVDAAAFHGADAVLLIVSILTPGQLRTFTQHAISLGLDVLVELHDTEDAAAAFDLLSSLTEKDRGHILLGINNRNLTDQTIDLRTTERLAELIRTTLPNPPPLISESGISSTDDIRMLSPHVQGFLIGSAILEAKNPDTFIRSLFSRS